MAKNRIYREYQGRQFELVVSSDFHGAMIDVAIFEIMPNRRFFKKRWLDNKSTFTNAHKSIEAGVEHLLAVYLQEEARQSRQRKKWADFENRGLTNATPSAIIIPRGEEND